MGAIVSLPITMASSFAASCCGSLVSSAVSRGVAGVSASLSTRLSYAMLFLLSSIVSWMSLTNWVGKKLSFFTGDSSVESGFFTVHRFMFALGLFHLLMSSLLFGVHSTSNPRASIQNSFWLGKYLVYAILLVVAFMIPNNFYLAWSKYVSVGAGAIFLLIGLILLVDFAHEWAETCMRHVEEDEDEGSELWKRILIGGTSLMYAASLAMTIVMYVYFTRGDCNMNKFAVTTNWILTLITSMASVHHIVQEYNPNCGLAQSAMVSVYCTYLTMSACASEPDDMQCNPLVRSSGTRRVSIIMGAVFTFVAIAYTTTRAAANSAFNNISIDYDEPRSSRNELRMAAIRQAVDEGSLPESALHDQSWYDEDEDDERIATQYNYSLFHIIFFLATQWTAILLTMNVKPDDLGDFVPVGRTYFYSWVKIVSAWICYCLYGWTLVAPAVFPERF